MALYIKANPKVAEMLHLDKDRVRLPDGNYLLWQMDMANFGPLFRLRENAARIGALVLTPQEALTEQKGTDIRPLPEATDPEYRYNTTSDYDDIPDSEETEPSEENEDTEQTGGPEYHEEESDEMSEEGAEE